ncbi:MAG TPA: hypothetical protein VGL18_03180 [Actinomycetota bacterium]|jgi:hypothetical protein
MLATAYEIGRFIGVVLFGLLIPALLTWWAIGLRERSSGVWWIPLAVGIFVSMSILLGPVIRASGDLRRDEKPNPARVDPETVFATAGTYRFQPFAEEVQASIERALEGNPARNYIEDFAIRDVLAEDGSPVAFIEVFAMDPEVLDEEDFREGFAQGAAEEAGGEVHRERVAGRDTLQFESTVGDLSGLHWVVWQRPRTNLLIMVAAPNSEDALAIAAAMIDRER